MADLFQQNNTLDYFQNRSETERQNQIDIINNFVSPEFIEAEKKKGKVTAFETLSNAKKWGYAVPYIGTGASIGESLKIKRIQDKASEGVQLTPEEMNTYKEFVLDMASLSARGQTIPSMAFDGLLQSIPYAVEMGVGLATSAEGVGLASLGQTGAKLGVKQAIKQGVVNTTKEVVKNKLANTTAKTLLRDTTIGVGKFNMKYLPQQGVKRFGEIEVDNNLYLTPEGEVLLNEAETNPAISALKAMAMTHIETISETAGYVFSAGGKALGSVIHSKVLDKLPKGFAKNFDKLAKNVTGLTGFKALEKYGFNGLLEEFGEERVADLLKVTFNLDEQEGYSFEQFVSAMFPPKEQAIAELLSFALMGGAGVGIKKSADYARYKTIANQIKDQSLKKDGTYNLTRMKKLIKQSNPSISATNLDKAINTIQNGILKTKDYSVDDFLLDCGVFRLHAKKSITDERLTEILEQGGLKEEAIEEFLDFASNDDKAQLLKMHEEANQKPQEDYSEIKKGLVQSGRTEEQADFEVQTLNKIDEVLLDKYNDEGQAEELIKNRNLKLNLDKLKEENAPAEEKTNSYMEEILNDLSDRYSKAELKELEFELEKLGDLEKYSKENLIDQLTQKTPRETIDRLREVNARTNEFLEAEKLRQKFYDYVANNDFGDERIYELSSLLKTTPKDYDEIKDDLDFRKKLGLEYIAGRNGNIEGLTKDEIWRKGYEKLLDIVYSENTEEFTPEEKPEPIDKYEDFGEVIHGAKKELWQSYQKTLQRPLSDDFEKISLKDFPEPNYEHLIREGVNVDILATIKALRDCIPTKPRGKYNSYKRKEYVTVIKFVRELASEFISGEKGLNDIEKALEKAPEIKAQVDLYIELGYPAFKNANDLKLMDGVTVFYKDGKRLEEPLKNQYSFAKGKQFIGKSFNTREEAIEYMRGLLSAEPEKQEKKTKLDIYQVRKTGEIIIGKKVGTNKWIDLKGGFTNSKDARAYYQEHEAELLELLKKRKETPETRHTANRDRVGEDYREGMNITPEKFANEFGFRGVQFGNYVEQKKRVQDINEAYDALLDLANLLDVPSRALSLNGSLGIAFGARGSKGAKAHYEPVEVVINLTKQKGAGSLAHEWWHALDNYFAKKEGVVVGHITDRHVSPNVRKEVFEAFKNVAKVVSKTMYDRSSKVDVTKTKDYWSTTHEMTARAFEAYIIGKAKLKGFTNDYLANILTEQEYTDIELYPYPLESEMAQIIEAYDNLFKVLKTEETEKGIAFYQSANKKNLTTFNQSAYHGTRIKGLENTGFDLSYALSGEGANAHGWGVYTAENKDVSEEYRKRLTNEDASYSMPVEVIYNNKEILDAELALALEEVANKGKEKAISSIKTQQGNLTVLMLDYDVFDEKYSELENAIKDLQEQLEFIEKMDVTKLKVAEREKQGQVYKVDIPESDVLLDEDKTFTEQPEKVKNGILQIFKEKNPINIVSEKIKWFDNILNELEQKAIKDGGYTTQTNYARDIYEDKKSELEKLLNKLNDYSKLKGKDIYKILSVVYEGDKEASLLLNDVGIKGITYDGYQDGRCYVIFDDKAVKILETFYQNEERAKIEFNGKETIITLAKGNDASSFMHELAHLYLHDLQELAKVNKRAEKDLQEVYKTLGFDSSADYTEEQFREMHEKFARTFEAYLMNGQAPTEKMKSVFEKFKEFLREIYNSLMDLEVEFSDEIKHCFDRLFTTDEEYENEVLPLYQQNDELAEQINQQDTFSYKIKTNMNALKETWKSFYDTVIIPFDTRLEKISPELKKILRKHTFDMTMQSKKDCDKITPFLLKIKEIKQNKTTVKLNEKEFNAYNILSYALNNRDSYTVNKLVKMLDIEKEFRAVRELLDDLHEQAESVGLEVGYLESYYPRMVQTEKTDAFVEMFERIAREEEIDIKEQYLEAGEAEYSNVKRQIAEKDVHGLWNNADKAKLINTSIRGFGKNNILLSRIGQLKFERLLDRLTPEQQRFYEPIEKALSNYVIGARKNIEERKFFGAENKEVSKLRASIKKKRETLRETKTRTPAQAKWKEMNRLKYELAPIEIKLETISGELKNNQERVKTIKDEEERAKVENYIATQKDTIKDLQSRAERLKSQLQWVEENNALKVKNVVVKRLNQDLEDLNKQINEILGSAEHVEDSIGRLIVDLAQKGIIHVKDERAVRDILVARFNQLRIEKFALGVRDVSTIVTLNDITNALTQITDLTFSAFKFGLFNTIEGMKKVEGLTREDLGIKNIAEEFRGASALSKWLNLQLKIIGLDLIDGFAKNTAINASILSARKKAKSKNKKFDEKLNYLFGERAKQVKQDLIDGKMTDEITFIAFNDLADIQPITTDQMTGGYQSGFKPFYVLKTYSIKALDILRNECFSKISSGIRNLKDNNVEGKKLIAEGIGNLIKLQLFMWLFGLPQDLLKDLIANREFDIPEHVIDNIIIFGIFNRYLIKKTSENPANIYLENIKLPALQAVGDLWTGIQQVKKGKKKVKDLYVWSRVPVVGKIYHNWFGGKKNKRVEL